MNQTFRRPENDTKEEEAYTYAMQLVTISALPMTLRAALELGLLRIISDAPGPLSSDELAAGLGLLSTNTRAGAMIERILRLLASYSILSYSSSPDREGRIIPRYGPTLVCKYFSPDKYGASLDALALMLQDKITMENWYPIKDMVVKGGTPFDLAHGTSIFDYCINDSEFNSVYNKGMNGHSSIIMKKVLDTYQGFHDINVVVDVGGGLGSTLNMIISKHIHIKGINFDLPHVISHAPLIPNVRHIGGDMFVDSIPSGDIIFMKWILHNWSDECCIKILNNCRKALPSGGKVVIVEYILPKSPDQHIPEAQLVFHVDLMMLTTVSGGKERTEKEFEVLALQSGFIKLKSVYINSNTCAIELSNE